MKHPQSQHGSVLIIVLWVSIGLVSLALYFANAMALELHASDNRSSSLAADQAIEGAARYVNYVLTQYATNGTIPDASTYQAEAVPVGDSHFWLIGRDNGVVPAHPGQVTFGLVDEASRLNLNTASTNVLGALPRMTSDLTDAILDWRGTNGTGSSQVYYAMQNPSYQCKNAPFETVDELRLVYGTSLDILAGDDVNRNGILDPNEKSDSGITQSSPGLLEYLTIYNREPNTKSDGTMRANVNDLSQLQPAMESALGKSRAAILLSRLGFRTTTGTNSPPAPTFRSPLEFYIRSTMSADEFAQVYPSIMVGTSQYTRNRVNINTASATVLACLPGMDIGTAQQAVNYRQTNPTALGSIAWIVDALGSTSAALQALQSGDYITTKSYQFTADIAAIGPYGRGYRRVKFIYDTSDGAPKIAYRQDLSRLGWALGDDVRQTWVTKVTQ